MLEGGEEVGALLVEGVEGEGEGRWESEGEGEGLGVGDTVGGVSARRERMVVGGSEFRIRGVWRYWSWKGVLN